MALRRFEPEPTLDGVTLQTPPTPTVVMNSNGSASTTFRGRTSAPTGSPAGTLPQCGLCGNPSRIDFRPAAINLPLEPPFPDHPLAHFRHPPDCFILQNHGQ